MAQPKYTLYKYVRLKGGSWRYCRAALYANGIVQPDLVLVGGREERHPEGNYYLACGGKWIPAGADALTAQRQQHAPSRYFEISSRIFLRPLETRTAAASGMDLPE